MSLRAAKVTLSIGLLLTLLAFARSHLDGALGILLLGLLLVITGAFALSSRHPRQ